MSVLQSGLERPTSVAELLEKPPARTEQLPQALEELEELDAEEERGRSPEPVVCGWHLARRLAWKYWKDRSWS